MPASILPGQPPTFGSGTPFGQVPQVPDPLSTANLAITGDIANLPSLTDLATQVNQFNTSQALAPYIANLPGYQSMVGQSSQNIGSLLRGEIPTDVMNLLNQQMAERGVASGLAGSPNANAAALQGLGLTSLGLQKQGEGELTAAIGRTPVPQLFNVAQFLTTPGDEQAAQMAANIYAAAPDPNLQAQELMKLFSQFMGRFSGGGGGGGTGVPNLNLNWPNMPGATYPPTAVSGGGGQLQVGPSPPNQTAGPPSPQVGTTGTGTQLGPANPNAWNLGGTSPSANWMNTLFGAPGYQDSSILGMGLDPLLNSLFGTAPPPQMGGGQGQQFDINQLFQQPALQDTGALGMGLDPGLNYLFGSQPNQFYDFFTGGQTAQQSPPQNQFYDFFGGGQTPYQDPNLSASGFSYNPFTDQSTSLYDPNASSTDPLSNMSSEDMAAYLGLEDWYSNP